MTGKEWLAVYEQSGEMPPAGVLARQLASMDAEIEALTRRNAELTAALGDAEDAWIDSDVHPRDAAGTCERCDRIAAIFAALTPTESEAK